MNLKGRFKDMWREEGNMGRCGRKGMAEALSDLESVFAADLLCKCGPVFDVLTFKVGQF